MYMEEGLCIWGGGCVYIRDVVYIRGLCIWGFVCISGVMYMEEGSCI